MCKLTRAEFFSQLTIASTTFRQDKCTSPTRLAVVHQLLQQKSEVLGKPLWIETDYCKDEQLMTMCHEAVLADVALQPLPSHVFSTFEFAWERYNAIAI